MLRKADICGTFNFSSDAGVGVKEMVAYVKEHINISPEHVSCFVCGLEFGDTESRPHLQMYIKLSSADGRYNYMSKFRNVFGFNFAEAKKVWWFKFARGTSKQNLEYCSKGGIFKLNI